MVKGISRQVIVVHGADPKLFEQAIFILKDDAVARGGIRDEDLLREARELINESAVPAKQPWFHGPVWGLCGAALSCMLWAILAVV